MSAKEEFIFIITAFCYLYTFVSILKSCLKKGSDADKLPPVQEHEQDNNAQ